ncbi:SGNH/GDSL hydrolase family protein [Blastococcus sp. CT_GayMR19]|uniref:GDSL-type esterase/lipase family protein n=1 Tax=Blastococcus sp. CT_GayMR19 TaxID=2559608 RepID=UPI0010732AB2|nr:GDSL-type esterase/lipase family protein [Blastococcus sp. CT_GayMR19]TFV73910.1 SGNH/GDSL hydrolase family protein [Blastococcus sp. CT_GayMR19]
MERFPLRLVVLGDSIGFGTGALRVEDTLGRRLATALTTDGFDVDLHVVAVPGAASRDLAAQVRRAGPLDADVAVIVIGANDLARFVPPGQAAASLASAVTALRTSGADVVVVPAPDMSSVPFVPPAFRAAVRAASQQLQQHQAAAVEAAGGRMAAVHEVGMAFAGDPAMFSADRFHPSSAGYAAIAAALTPAVLAAARSRRGNAAA